MPDKTAVQWFPRKPAPIKERSCKKSNDFGGFFNVPRKISAPLRTLHYYPERRHELIMKTGNWKKDVEAVVSLIANQLQTAPWAKILPSLIDAAERDREAGHARAPSVRRLRLGS